MSSETSLEASIKIRQGKKWKSRYCVIHKLSPNADYAQLDHYENEKKRKNGKKKTTIVLEGFFGTESGFTLDKETETIAVICHSNVVILSFDSQERLVQWDIWLRNAFGCGCQYRLMVVAAPENTSLLDRQNVRLHLQDSRFCITTDTPPRIVAEFRLKDIRIYGPIQNKFCFEAGSRNGDNAGTYILLSSQTEQINVSFYYAAQNALHNHLSKKLCLPEAVEVTKTNFATVGVIVKGSGIRVLPDARTNVCSPSVSSSNSLDFRERIYSNAESFVSESRPLLDSFTSSCSIGDRSLATFTNNVFEDEPGSTERCVAKSSVTCQQRCSPPLVSISSPTKPTLNYVSQRKLVSHIRADGQRCKIAVTESKPSQFIFWREQSDGKIRGSAEYVNTNDQNGCRQDVDRRLSLPPRKPRKVVPDKPSSKPVPLDDVPCCCCKRRRDYMNQVSRKSKCCDHKCPNERAKTSKIGPTTNATETKPLPIFNYTPMKPASSKQSKLIPDNNYVEMDVLKESPPPLSAVDDVSPPPDPSPEDDDERKKALLCEMVTKNIVKPFQPYSVEAVREKRRLDRRLFLQRQGSNTFDSTSSDVTDSDNFADSPRVTCSSRNSPVESILEEDACPDEDPSSPPSNIDLDEVSLSGTIVGNQNSKPAIRLVSTKRSMRSQKRLREELSRPISGSYVCYDGEPESPLVLVPPLMKNSQSNYTPPILSTVETQNCTFPNSAQLNNLDINSENVFNKDDYVCDETLNLSNQRQSVQRRTPLKPSSRPTTNKHWTPVSAPPIRIRRNDSVFKFPPSKSILNSQLNYCELETSNPFMREGGSEPLPYHALAPKSAFVFPSTPVSPGLTKSGIEYAKIDEVATMAVMKNTTARAVERREKWSSIQTLSDDSGKETAKPSKRAFLLRPNLLRRRTSLSSLTGSTGGTT